MPTGKAAPSYWAEKRSEAHPEVSPVQSVQKFGEGLMRTVRDMARRYDDVVIDAGAGTAARWRVRCAWPTWRSFPCQPAGLERVDAGLDR